MYITQEGGAPMRGNHYDETTPRTEPKGDVDDLIFCAGPDWSVSQR